MMLTDKELQTLRNQGNDDAADEIESLRAKLEALRQQTPVFWGPRMAIKNRWDSVTVRAEPARETDIPLYLATGAQAAPVWQNCPTHGRADASAWGCPECVREMRDKIQRLRAAVLANHEWHQRTDDYGGYHESEICEINTAALASAPKPGDANAAL